MATEKVEAITLSLREYKAQLDNLRAALAQATQGSNEYKNLQDEIIERQSRLTEAMRVGKEAYDAQEGSVNALRKEISDLTKEFNSLGAGDKRDKLGERINGLRDQLKELDASVGKFQMNVGDYATQFSKAFNGMGGNVVSLIGQFGNMGKALKLAFATNPIGLIILAITALIGLLNQVKEAIKGDEELSMRWSEAVAAFEPIILDLKEGVSKLADGFVWLIEQISAAYVAFQKFLDKMGLLNEQDKHQLEMTEKSIKLKKEENAQIKKKRENQVELATLQNNLAKLETEAAKVRYKDNTEYQRLLKEQQDTVKRMADIKEQEKAEDERLAKERASMARNSIEDNNKIAEAEAARIQANTDGLRTIAGLQARLSRAENKDANAMAAEAKKTISDIYDQIDAYQRLYDAQVKVNTREIDIEKAELDRQIAANEIDQVKYNEEILKLEEQRRFIMVNVLEGVKQTVEESKEYKESFSTLFNFNKITSDAEEFKLVLQSLYEFEKTAPTDTKREGAYAEIFNEEIFREKSEEFVKAYNQFIATYISMDEKRQELELQVSNQEAKIQQQQISNRKEILANEFEEMDWMIRRSIDARKKELDFVDFEIKYKVKPVISTEEFDTSDFKKKLDEKIENVLSDREYSKKLSENDYNEFTTYGKILTEIYEEIAVNTKRVKNNMFADTYQAEQENLQKQVEAETIASNLSIQNIENEYTQKIDRQQKYLDTLAKNTDEYNKAQRDLDDLENEKFYAQLQAYEDYYTKLDELQQKGEFNTKKHNEAIQKSYVQLSRSMAGLLGGIADVMEENIKQKQKDGRISEKQAKDEFERVKKVQLAELWINTLAGAAGAFLQDMKNYPSPYNAIIGGIDMATAMATGIAQHKKIQAMEFGSAGGNGDTGGLQGISVNPLLNEQRDVRQLEATDNAAMVADSVRNIKVYVTETDITEKQNQQRARVTDTTF